MPGRCLCLCLPLYFGCGEGNLGAFWFVILLERPHERCHRLRAVGHRSRRRYETLSCDMNTTHGLRCLQCYFAAVRAAFADVDHVVVVDHAELAAAAAAGGV